eukprot:CAMPEP_0119407310 /NCGR_PEP_ID=MMETSP1335-20130426/1251_1 /TAXON_ID=259385 /ORGANISM="Chrysoculter rhomboideus, Strain RCC1486" /LENGTH=90 /DNA_ID=CAMNT_0007431407 /DNA_START=533 /DNA_END=805 /DNA_ORIENTATION=+
MQSPLHQAAPLPCGQSAQSPASCAPHETFSIDADMSAPGVSLIAGTSASDDAWEVSIMNTTAPRTKDSTAAMARAPVTMRFDSMVLRCMG